VREIDLEFLDEDDHRAQKHRDDDVVAWPVDAVGQESPDHGAQRGHRDRDRGDTSA
jgi:hypothetical protein